MAARIVMLVVFAAVVALPGTPPVADDDDGFVPTSERRQRPDAIEASFARESYAPGATATLRVFSSVADVRARVYRVGEEKLPTVGYDEMRGVPVSDELELGDVRRGGWVAIALGDWPSGLYFAELRAPGRVGYAPFVLRPARLGTSNVAVVMPTRTWHAYNFRDDDGDGRADTWYERGAVLRVRLGRPFLHRGVPPHFRQYDLPFLRWLARSGKRVDVLAQADLDRASAARLAAAYDLIVFPGHHEYVTAAEYGHVTGYRDRGGNLAFLSANNFFWRIEVRRGVMTRVAKWRKLGRPEAALIGVQYAGNDRGERRGPWLVRRSAAARWVFADVKLSGSNAFASGGIEIDSVAPASPKGVEVVAEIPNLLGPGRTAQMSYYETANGARVFAAGAFTLAGQARDPSDAQLLENVWRRLAEGDE